MKARTAEHQRLQETAEGTQHWRRWGPYLSERQWGTVREDYSGDGEAWEFVPHDLARSYAYRWGEDGIGGLSDNHQRLCFGVTLWNGKDPILKERLFGLSNHEGNHGEDVKEAYWYLDATPSHSYLKMRYRYPIHAYPYAALIYENANRSRSEAEYEIHDTGIFDHRRYFDVDIEYAKAGPNDICMRYTVTNCSEETTELVCMPTAWFRNTWQHQRGTAQTPRMKLSDGGVHIDHSDLGFYHWQCDGAQEIIFTDNETNPARFQKIRTPATHFKDAFHEYLIHGNPQALSGDTGTKVAAVYRCTLNPGETRSMCARLSPEIQEAFDAHEVRAVMDARIAEADAFFATLPASGNHAAIHRAALAGLIWNKQWYHYWVDRWIKGDEDLVGIPPERALLHRNRHWQHVYNDDVLLMPDSWEYPWFAVWDSAFHSVTLAVIDGSTAKRQLDRYTREWFMHPNGQLPAYEWEFGDVNPPVHGWATWAVYTMEKQASEDGKGDTEFLERIFHKLLMNFTWWCNRKDVDNRNLFEGGFLGMDNIGVFDRSKPVPGGGILEQSDGTSWMAMYSLNLLAMSWELAQVNAAYEGIASKFFEHFLTITHAIYNGSGKGEGLWCEDDGFFHDQIQRENGHRDPVKLRSMVGLIPLLAVELLEHDTIEALPDFHRRMQWFFDNRPDLAGNISCLYSPDGKRNCLLAVVGIDKLERILTRMLDEKEFLSPYGVRSMSKYHLEHPVEGVHYEPGESASPLFGGNSNWRGPIWFPVNYLLIQALRRYGDFLGDSFRIECPTGSGNAMTLCEVADEISRRLIRLFELNDHQQRPAQTGRFAEDPDWRDLHLFHEFFHGETGEGLGAAHQTGWTALVANLIEELER
jgi:hypothetical protein